MALEILEARHESCEFCRGVRANARRPWPAGREVGITPVTSAPRHRPEDDAYLVPRGTGGAQEPPAWSPLEEAR
eukprot:7261044-Heterocapsa_arctica.AAC.1